MRINGRDYELRYSINTLCQMCDNGIDVMHLDQLVINVKTIRDLFMYGLKHDIKKITQNQAGELMDDYLEEHDFNELVAEVMGCLAKSLGGGEASEEEDEGKLRLIF